MSKRDTNQNLNQEYHTRADQSMHQLCKTHMYYHVLVKTSDGQKVEGIITDLDSKNVYLLVPQEMMPSDEGQQQGQQGSSQQMSQTGEQSGQQMPSQQGIQLEQRQWYGVPCYKRFYRQIFPISGLVALSLYPYYNQPYRYPNYPYPY